MASNNTVSELMVQFDKLNKYLISCNEDLKKMINEKKESNVSQLSFINEDKKPISEISDIEDYGLGDKLSKMKATLNSDSENLDNWANRLKKISKKKDLLEKKQKNSDITNKVYRRLHEWIKNENVDFLEDKNKDDSKDKKGEKDKSQTFSSIEQSKNRIQKQINDLYDEYQETLNMMLSVPRPNYMKSATDTIYASIENLAQTLERSYAFHIKGTESALFT